MRAPYVLSVGLRLLLTFYWRILCTETFHTHIYIGMMNRSSTSIDKGQNGYIILGLYWAFIQRQATYTSIMPWSQTTVIRKGQQTWQDRNKIAAVTSWDTRGKATTGGGSFLFRPDKNSTYFQKSLFSKAVAAKPEIKSNKKKRGREIKQHHLQTEEARRPSASLTVNQSATDEDTIVWCLPR